MTTLKPCPFCGGKWHAFPAYVFAHWKEPLKHKWGIRINEWKRA